MSLPSVETARSWPAKGMVGREGDPLGRIAYIYLDRVTGQPTWAVVVLGGLRRKRAFVPLTQAVQEEDRVHVPVTGATVRNAPGPGRRGKLLEQHEAQLLEHYGEPARSASSRSGARRASRAAADAGARVRRWPRQGQRATTAAKAAGKSHVLRRVLWGGLGFLVGSVAASRLPGTRRRAPSGVAARKGARWRRVALPTPLSWSQRRSQSMAGDVKLAVGFSLGWALGSPAGRKRCRQIAEQARRLWQRPEPRDLAANRCGPTSARVEATAPSGLPPADRR
jgi:hypothetical protein